MKGINIQIEVKADAYLCGGEIQLLHAPFHAQWDKEDFAQRSALTNFLTKVYEDEENNSPKQNGR
jgi:hypothetical protein